MGTTTLTRPTIRVNAADLKHALAWAVRNMSGRPTVPILAGVKMEATSEGRLAISAFDYETHASIVIGVDGDLPAEPFIAHGKTLADMAARLTGDVTITVDGPLLTLASKRTRFTVGLMPADDYPLTPPPAPIVGTIDGADLAALAAAAHACSDRTPQSPKVELTGTRIIADPTTLTVWATDRYKLLRGRTPWTGEPFDVLIPAATLAAATKDLTGQVKVGVDPNRVTLIASDRAVSIGILAGEHLPLDRLFDVTLHEPATVERAALVDATQAARIAGDAMSAGGTLVRLDVRDGELTVDAGAADGSTASASTIPLDGEPGIPFQVILNSEHLLTALAAVDTPNALIHPNAVTPGLKPGLITGDGTGRDIAVLIQPVRK